MFFCSFFGFYNLTTIGCVKCLRSWVTCKPNCSPFWQSLDNFLNLLVIVEYISHEWGRFTGFSWGKYMLAKTVFVLKKNVYFFLLPQRPNSGYILSTYPLRYSRSKLCAEAKISVLWYVLSAWSEWMKTTSPAEWNRL